VINHSQKMKAKESHHAKKEKRVMVSGVCTEPRVVFRLSSFPATVRRITTYLLTMKNTHWR
jgi:hypothetical protein